MPLCHPGHHRPSLPALGVHPYQRNLVLHRSLMLQRIRTVLPEDVGKQHQCKAERRRLSLLLRSRRSAEHFDGQPRGRCATTGRTGRVFCQMKTVSKRSGKTDMEMSVLRFGFRPSTPRTNLWLEASSSNEIDTSGRQRVFTRSDCMPCIRTTGLKASAMLPTRIVDCAPQHLPVIDHALLRYECKRQH